MYKLEKQIIEMENFASHLEEVFITVEVRAHCRAHQTRLLPSVAGAAAASSARQRISCLRACGATAALLHSNPSLPQHPGPTPHGTSYLPAFSAEP